MGDEMDFSFCMLISDMNFFLSLCPSPFVWEKEGRWQVKERERKTARGIRSFFPLFIHHLPSAFSSLGALRKRVDARTHALALPAEGRAGRARVSRRERAVRERGGEID
mmetsp:Transcript_42598/g.83998  ORF Transcript_42598/g.83998 Transcript_42598/m.83998 type:complete len:109 (-) Transcript_42598:397-723(-)